MLYLENNLAPRVFTPDRLAVLELLASQAAISLKNAQLYADLQQENSERRKAEEELRQSTDALNQLQEEVRQASRAAMMGELTASLAHELNQPLGAILSNAQAVRRFLAGKSRTSPKSMQPSKRSSATIRGRSKSSEMFARCSSGIKCRCRSVDLKQVLLDVERILCG